MRKRRLITTVAIVTALVAGAVALWLNKRAIEAGERARKQLEVDVAAAYAADPAIASADRNDLPETAAVAGPILAIEVTPGVDGARPQTWLDKPFDSPRRARAVADARAFAIVRTDDSLMYTAPGSLPDGVITAVTVTIYDRAHHVAVCRKAFRHEPPRPPVTEAQLDAFGDALWGDVAAYLRTLP